MKSTILIEKYLAGTLKGEKLENFKKELKNSSELHKQLGSIKKEFGDLIKDYRTTLVNEECLINYFPIISGD